MNCLPGNTKQQQLFSEILLFLGRANGLRSKEINGEALVITQIADSKSIKVDINSLSEVLFRNDNDGREFIQVNFSSGQKILITESLIGFKPSVQTGLDSSKLPRVVTTPDVVSVFEAIQDALHATVIDQNEITVLRKVYDAVLSGGESVGFDLAEERAWLSRIPSCFAKVAA